MKTKQKSIYIILGLTFFYTLALSFEVSLPLIRYNASISANLWFVTVIFTILCLKDKLKEISVYKYLVFISTFTGLLINGLYGSLFIGLENIILLICYIAMLNEAYNQTSVKNVTVLAALHLFEELQFDLLHMKSYITIGMKKFYKVLNTSTINRDTIKQILLGSVFGIMLMIIVTSILSQADYQLKGVLHGMVVINFNYVLITRIIIAFFLSVCISSYINAINSVTKKIELKKDLNIKFAKYSKFNLSFITALIFVFPIYIIYSAIELTYLMQNEMISYASINTFVFTNIVVSLNIVLIVLSFLFIKQESIKSRMVLISFSALSIIITLISGSQLIAYISQYGLTQRRYFGIIEMIVLCAILIVFIGKYINFSIKVFPKIVLVSVNVFVLLQMVNPETLIYQYNQSTGNDQVLNTELAFTRHSKFKIISHHKRVISHSQDTKTQLGNGF